MIFLKQLVEQPEKWKRLNSQSSGKRWLTHGALTSKAAWLSEHVSMYVEIIIIIQGSPLMFHHNKSQLGKVCEKPYWMPAMNVLFFPASDDRGFVIHVK